MTHMTTRDPVRARARLLLMAALLTALCAGCNSTPVAKTGAPASRQITLRMLMPEGGDPQGNYFVQAVERLSKDRLKVVIDADSYTSSDPAQEARVVQGLRDGRGDLGFITARNWASDGDPGFQAVMTPFALTTLGATVRLSTGPVAGTLLNGLEARGVVGLGLVAGEPRQLLSTRPLFGPTLQGARIRIVDNSQTAALITALGGVPVPGIKALPLRDALKSGTVVGAETSPLYALNNSYNTVAHHLTGYGLFPKLSTLVATRTAWQRLSHDDQQILRQAAADTVQEAARDLPGRLTKELDTLCRSGVVVDVLPSDDLTALVAAADAATPADDRVARARSMLQTLPGAGPQALAATPPLSCRLAHTAAESSTLTKAVQGTTDFIHRGGSTIPPGVYTVTLTAAEFHAAGNYGPDFNRDVTYTQTFRPDGTFLGTQEPDYPDQGPVAGRYAVTGDTVTFTLDPATGLGREVVRWSYFEGQLSFQIVNVQDTTSVLLYTAHPWRRTA